MCFPWCVNSVEPDEMPSTTRFFRTSKRGPGLSRRGRLDSALSANLLNCPSSFSADGDMVRARVSDVYDINRVTLSFFMHSSSAYGNGEKSEWVKNCTLIGIPPHWPRDPRPLEWLTKRLLNKLVWVECLPLHENIHADFKVVLYTDANFNTSVNEEFLSFLNGKKMFK